MDGDDKLFFGFLAFIVGLLVLYFIACSQVNNEVDNARTPEELQRACSGLTVQSAPVKCLQVINK